MYTIIFKFDLLRLSVPNLKKNILYNKIYCTINYKILQLRRYIKNQLLIEGRITFFFAQFDNFSGLEWGWQNVVTLVTDTIIIREIDLFKRYIDYFVQIRHQTLNLKPLQYYTTLIAIPIYLCDRVPDRYIGEIFNK